MRIPSFLAGVALVFASLAPAAFAQLTPPGVSQVRTEPEVAEEVPHARGRARPANPGPARANAVSLERATAEEIAQRMSPPRKGLPHQIGFGRDLTASASEASLRALLTWETEPDGSQVAALSISSPGAAALRAGLRVIQLPPELVLRFRGHGSDTMFEVTGEEIVETIARNLEAGDTGPEARMFWAPAVESDTVVIEFDLPADARPEDIRMSIPQLSHIVATREEPTPKASSTCQLDAKCHEATWGMEMNSVARLIFVISGASYQCSGTLIADRDTTTAIPYFLSANHCISSQTVASTLQTWWFYRSPSCNSGTFGRTILTGGATLLYASANTDTSFMQLNNPPPGGATYAGWIIGSTPALNSALTGLHHPAGDPLKISFASLWSYARCFSTGGDQFACDTASSGTATFFAVLWNSGLTEGGSSGSGLFLNNGHYLIGQLYGGSSACGSSAGPDFYGRFDVAYNAGMSQWLSPALRTLTVSKAGVGTGTVTSSPAGISCGTTCSATFSQSANVTLTATPSGSSTFTGWSGACSGTGSCSVNMGSDNTVTATFNDPALTPGAPQNLAATPGSGQATFTFTPPSNTGGSAIVRYTVTCSGSASAFGPASPIVVTGLQNGSTYSCSATATNATTTGPASGSVSVTPAAAPLALLGVVSRKTHVVTPFELPVDMTKLVTGALTVEPRGDNTHKIVFRFNSPITSAGVVTVTDVNGAAVGTAQVTVSGSEIMIELTGVDGRRARITLSGVNGQLTTSAAVAFLMGDVDSSGAITASDLLRFRGRVGQGAIASTFTFDDDLDGLISNVDLLSAKSRAGTSAR